MVKDVGPGDRIIDGNMVRTGANQVTSFRDLIVPVDTPDYDEYAAAVSAEDVTIRDVGAHEDQSFSRIRNNPWSPSEKSDYWEDGTSPGTVAWAAGQPMQTGETYGHNDQKWMCIQAHTSQVDWEPQNVPALFVLVPPSGSTTWAQPVPYVIGDERTHNDIWYRCIQNHTSQAGWEPPNVPALWELI